MRCPLCGCENLDGADSCERCKTSLVGTVQGNGRRPSLEGKIARDALSVLKPAAPVTVSPDDAVGEVIALLARRNIGCALVVSEGALVGIFTERDALMKVGASLEKVGQEPVSHFMTPSPESLLLSDSIAFALNRMAVGDYRHVPIEKDHRPVGISSVRDVLEYLTRQFPEVLTGA